MPEYVLEHLAHRVAGKFGDEFELFGDLLLGQPAPPRRTRPVRRSSVSSTPGASTTRAQARSPVRSIGQADHGHVGDRRVLGQDVLDLLRRQVLGVADDDVLEPAGDARRNRRRRSSPGRRCGSTRRRRTRRRRARRRRTPGSAGGHATHNSPSSPTGITTPVEVDDLESQPGAIRPTECRRTSPVGRRRRGSSRRGTR